MKYIGQNHTIEVRWTIQRGATRLKEDFRRASLFVFLVAEKDIYPVQYTLDDNIIRATLRENLPEGVYGLRAIWYKDRHNPFEAPYRHGQNCPPFIGRASESQVDDVFGITGLSEEDESVAENTVQIALTSSVATFGYDGLSAYEMAVIRGLTTQEESQWLANLSDINDRMQEIEDAEVSRTASEKLRIAAETVRTADEKTRAEAEQEREDNEQERQDSEVSRRSYEKQREAAELVREQNERARVAADAKRFTPTYYKESQGAAVLSAPTVSVSSTGSGTALHLEGYQVKIVSGLDNIVLTPGNGYKVLIGTTEVATVDMLEDIKARLAALEAKG